MAVTTLPSCCSFRKIKAGQAWGEYKDYVRRLSKHQTLTSEQQKRMTSLKEIARTEREAFREHCADESLEHR
jgi:hypothetical protein